MAPEQGEELKAEGLYETTVQATAIQAMQEIESLMKAGYPDFAAEEVVLPELVLLKPEGDGLLDWERRELDELERNYRKNVVPYLP